MTIPAERKSFLHDLYRSQLEGEAKIKYVRSFEMYNRSDRLDYFLFFGTRSIEGLKKMKEAMWKIDEAGLFHFSDATDPTQSVLFEAMPNVTDLRGRLLAAFGGKAASIQEIEDFVLSRTPFRETHFKRQLLAPMEKAIPAEIEILSAPPGRKRGQYPLGTTIRFPMAP
jgi:hypothetical protein